MTSTGRPVASWYPDPTGRHQHRYWDGERWTVHVADNGVTGIDGATQQAVAQQQAAVDEPRSVTPQPQPQAQPQPQPGWAPVPERPAPTAQYAWQPSSPTAAWQTAEWQASTGATSPGRSSKGRGWIFAIAILVAVAGIGATAMVALGRGDDTTTSAVSGDRRYPETIETTFMRGCTSTGGTESYCRCALDHLEQDYDLGEFAEAERSYTATGKLPDEMMNAARDCLPELYR